MAFHKSVTKGGRKFVKAKPAQKPKPKPRKKPKKK